MQLPGHTDNHVVEIGIEVFSLWNVHSIWGFEMIAGHDIVDVVDSSWSESDFEEISWPDSTVGVFSLILGIIWSVNVIMNISVSFIPLLIIILLEVLMCGVNGEVLSNPTGKLELFVYFVQ